MLLGLFLVGTLWFWILMAVATLVVGICVARESYRSATFSVIATFAALGFLGDFNVLHWLREHWTEFAVYLVAYFAIGTAWSVGKWWFFVRNKRDEYNERKRQFLINHGFAGDAPLPDKLKTDWRDLMDSDRSYSRRESFPPKARAFKGKIMAWMMYWPWSFVVTIIDDPIRKLFNAIFRAIHGAFQRISDSVFKDVKDDFVVAPPPTPQGGGNGSAKDTMPPPAGDGGENTPRIRSV